jgi:hypothetical protein
MIGQYVAGVMVKSLKELNGYNGADDSSVPIIGLTL